MHSVRMQDQVVPVKIAPHRFASPGTDRDQRLIRLVDMSMPHINRAKGACAFCQGCSNFLSGRVNVCRKATLAGTWPGKEVSGQIVACAERSKQVASWEAICLG